MSELLKTSKADLAADIADAAQALDPHGLGQVPAGDWEELSLVALDRLATFMDDLLQAAAERQAAERASQ
jgi:hypothetical protein